jgi:hypothetical protein
MVMSSARLVLPRTSLRLYPVRLFVGLIYFAVSEPVELNDTKNGGTRMEHRRKIILGSTELMIYFFV